LIDDSEMVRMTTGAILEDYDVAEAESLADARAQLAAGAFDVIILDQHLGDGLGTDLIPEIRRRLPQATVVVMSGSAAVDELQGADLIWLKGEPPERMLALLEQSLRR
jgi:DNA-binding NtrC family response regulator